MAGFRFLTAGESHGQSLGAILEGVPAGLPLTAAQIASDLARRQRGYGRGIYYGHCSLMRHWLAGRVTHRGSSCEFQRMR